MKWIPFAISFGFEVDEDLLLASVDQAIELGDNAALLGLLRWIAGDSRLISSSLLQAGSGETPIVRLATDAKVSKIRYEAALAVSKIALLWQGNGPMPYAGSSRVAKTLSEMVSLTDRPLAIVVETRREVIVSLETLLSDLGYRIIEAPTVSRMLTAIDQGGDLQLILAKTQLWDMPAIELVDRARRTPRGRDVPIVLYGDDEVQLGEQRWDAPTVVMPQPASAAALSEVLEISYRNGRLMELSSLDRREFRSRASDILDQRRK